MLSFVFTDTQDTDYIFSQPLSMSLRMDEDVPADDLAAVFPYEPVGELTKITVYDNGNPLFVGVVDEQEHLFTERGKYLRVCARSLAAHLLDNEAMPQSYDHPSADLIYERHVKPYGIQRENAEDAIYFGEQTVTKGMSQWAVLKHFCIACYSVIPRITANGYLRMKGIESGGVLCFSDAGDGIPYTELSEVKKRCEEISRVNVKLSDTGGYRYPVENTDAISRGVRRERYLNAVLASTPITCADTMLLNGEAASYTVRLKCPDRLTDVMGSGAVIRNRERGVLENLYICGVSYALDDSGEITTLRLKRRNS